MNLAVRIAAAILSVPPDVLAPMVKIHQTSISQFNSTTWQLTHFSFFQVPMMAPPPRNTLELKLREEIDSALSGSCCSASSDATPLFVLSESETSFVNCQSGLPASEKDLFAVGGDEATPSTYGEITMLGVFVETSVSMYLYGVSNLLSLFRFTCATGARQLFYHMGLSTPNRRTIHDGNSKLQFFDLGSGGGRLVLQSHLELPSVCRSVGIELSPTRHEIAMRRLNELLLGGTIERIRALAHKSWGWKTGGSSSAVVDLYEGDLFELDIMKATHMYLSSLCFSESMLERVVDKIEMEGHSLQIVASLRLLPQQKSGDYSEKKDEHDKARVVRLGENPWIEFIEMTWTRGDGCPVYFYSIKPR
jgi:hypothetical protein